MVILRPRQDEKVRAAMAKGRSVRSDRRRDYVSLLVVSQRAPKSAPMSPPMPGRGDSSIETFERAARLSMPVSIKPTDHWLPAFPPSHPIATEIAAISPQSVFTFPVKPPHLGSSYQALQQEVNRWSHFGSWAGICESRNAMRNRPRPPPEPVLPSGCETRQFAMTLPWRRSFCYVYISPLGRHQRHPGKTSCIRYRCDYLL